MCRNGQHHECGGIAAHALSNGFGLAAQCGALALDTTVQQFGIQGVEGIGNRQRHHAMATAVADYTLDTAFVVALGGPSEFILKQVVALPLCKFLGPHPFAIAPYLGHGKLGVVV